MIDCPSLAPLSLQNGTLRTARGNSAAPTGPFTHVFRPRFTGVSTAACMIISLAAFTFAVILAPQYIIAIIHNLNYISTNKICQSVRNKIHKQRILRQQKRRETGCLQIRVICVFFYAFQRRIADAIVLLVKGCSPMRFVRSALTGYRDFRNFAASPFADDRMHLPAAPSKTCLPLTCKTFRLRVPTASAIYRKPKSRNAALKTKPRRHPVFPV